MEGKAMRTTDEEFGWLEGSKDTRGTLSEIQAYILSMLESLKKPDSKPEDNDYFKIAKLLDGGMNLKLTTDGYNRRNHELNEEHRQTINSPPMKKRTPRKDPSLVYKTHSVSWNGVQHAFLRAECRKYKMQPTEWVRYKLFNEAPKALTKKNV